MKLLRLIKKCALIRPNTTNGEKLRPKDLGFMVLSIIAVVVVMLLTFSKLENEEPEIYKVLLLIDLGICIIFIGNFFFDLVDSKNYKRYIFTRWIDLIASIPIIAISAIFGIDTSDNNIFRYARFFQVLRVIQLIRISRDTLIPLLKKRKKETTLTVLMLTMVTIITLASALILLVEYDAPAAAAKIDSAEKAIWWALVTISTVGYGDYHPVTLGGRVIATLLILVGVAFFSIAAGFIASKFVSWQEEEAGNPLQKQQNKILEEIRELRKKLDSRDN